MKKLLLWICRKLNIVTVEKKTEYVVNWFPKPNNSEMVSMIEGFSFKYFMEFCQKKAAISVAMQTTAEARNEHAIILEGVHKVEQWAKEYVENNKYVEQEKVETDSISLEPDVLIREYNEMEEAKRAANGM